MRLVDLEPRFLQIETPQTFKTVAAITDADGIIFLCPKCFVRNSSPVNTHSVICWRPVVPQTIEPTPGRWEFSGSSLDDLSLYAGSSSILLTGEGCQAHFFITDGEVLMA